jgi:hypothetical protein
MARAVADSEWGAARMSRLVFYAFPLAPKSDAVQLPHSSSIDPSQVDLPEHPHKSQETLSLN